MENIFLVMFWHLFFSQYSQFSFPFCSQNIEKVCSPSSWPILCLFHPYFVWVVLQGLSDKTGKKGTRELPFSLPCLLLKQKISFPLMHLVQCVFLWKNNRSKCAGFFSSLPVIFRLWIQCAKMRGDPPGLDGRLVCFQHSTSGSACEACTHPEERRSIENWEADVGMDRFYLG